MLADFLGLSTRAQTASRAPAHGAGQVETSAGDAILTPADELAHIGQRRHIQGQPKPDQRILTTVRATTAWTGIRRLYGLMATAKVTSTPEVEQLVTPAWLELVATDLILLGESTWVLGADRMAFDRLRATTWQGKREDRSDWTVVGTIPAPSQAVARRWAYDDVLHMVSQPDPDHPWRGQGLLAASESYLLWSSLMSAADRISAPFATILAHHLPIPAPALKSQGDLARRSFSDLVSHLRGEVPYMTLTQSGQHGQEKLDAIELNSGGTMQPVQQIIQAAEHAHTNLRDAAGIPAALMPGNTVPQADTVREALSSFLEVSLMPMARIIELELEAKLGRPVTLDLSHLKANEIVGGGRAARLLAQAGYDLTSIAEVIGLPQLRKGDDDAG